MDSFDELLDVQEGVIARGQILESGRSTALIRRNLRRREWVAVYPGVYVTHTGPLMWRQRAWAAVLDASPAALSHASALADAGSSDEEPIHIVVDQRRRVTRRPGVVVHYRSRFDETLVQNTSPPRLRVEEAVLDLASGAASEGRAVAVLADAVSSRTTTAKRLLDAVRKRLRCRRRAFIEGVLADVRTGTCSVLEHGYLTQVERAHGLPTPIRQAPTTAGRRGFRDVDYDDWGVVVELDGRLAHDGPLARDRDLERDLDAAVGAHRRSLRLGWGQVFDRPCSTARKVAAVLSSGGWGGEVLRCPSFPPPPLPPP